MIPDPPAKRRLTHLEVQTLFSLVEDYVMFGLTNNRIQKIITEKTKRSIPVKTIRRIRTEIEKKRQSSENWGNEFAKSRLLDHFRERIERMQYLEKELLALFDEELSKEKKSTKNIVSIAHVIVETDKALAEYAQAPVILTKIQQLIPLDVKDYNPFVEEKATKLINRAHDIDSIETNSAGEDTTEPAEEDDDPNAVF